MRPVLSGLVITSVIFCAQSSPEAGGRIYDMTPFLNEPHPFATGYYSARPAADPPPPSYPFGQRPPGAASAWPPTSPSGSVNRAQPAGRQAQAASSPAAGNSASTGVLRPDWSVLLGAGVGMRPSYMGSDNLEVAGLPIVDIRWRDTVFLKTSGGMTSRVGLGFNVLNQQGFRIGPMIEYYMGQDTGDEISGMNDVDGGAEVGLFAEYNFKPWKAEAVARYGVAGGNDGFLMTGGLTWTTKLGRDLILSLGADASFGDGNYMDSYFGVSAVEAARSGLAPYDPGWGVRDVGLNLKMVYPFYGNFRLIGTGRFNYLLDEAADSPVVDTAGEEAQFSFGLAIAYQF